MDNLERWKFGTKNNYLVDLVLKGKKTATTSIYRGDKQDKYSILCYSNNNDACLIKTEKIIIMKFKEMEWEYAKLEGENNNLKEWVLEHKKFFKSIDPAFNDNSYIEFEIFKVVEIFN